MLMSILVSIGMSSPMSNNILRLVRPITDSPAIYARPAHNDHKFLCQLVSEGRAGVAGVVFDPAFVEEQKELLGAINQRGLWSILDPKTMELSTPGGLTTRRRNLSWAMRRPHTPSDLEGKEAAADYVRQIATFVLEHNYSAVLAPSHYLARGIGDPWFKVDIRLLEGLRQALDDSGAKDVAIHYPLCIPTSVLFDPAQRIALKLAFSQTAKVDAIWLRVHPFGGHSGHVTLENYIGAARDIQEAGIPLVGEKVGAVGPALLAFGAIGGLEMGVSSGESFDYKRLLKKGVVGKGFGPHRGVAIDALGICLEAKMARPFFENRTLRAQYGCKDTSCCRQGYVDTLKEPRRHFVITRLSQISELSAAPYQDRPKFYLERFLRPATDKLGRVAQAEIPTVVMKRIEREQRKLSGWRNTLGLLSQIPLSTPAKVPAKRVERVKKMLETVI